MVNIVVPVIEAYRIVFTDDEWVNKERVKFVQACIPDAVTFTVIRAVVQNFENQGVPSSTHEGVGLVTPTDLISLVGQCHDDGVASDQSRGLCEPHDRDQQQHFALTEKGCIECQFVLRKHVYLYYMFFKVKLVWFKLGFSGDVQPFRVR